jgi:uncharacterized protein YhaN
MAQLRVGASLDVNGVTQTLQRRKGNKDTLRNGAGDLLADSVLSSWLGGVSRVFFESRFSIGRAELEGGAQMLADAHGDAATSIYGAALAGIDPNAVIEEMEIEAHRIFLPRGKNQLLNAAINEFGEKKKLVAQTITRPDEWQELSRERDENVAALDASRNRIAKLQNESERYKNICKALDSYDAIKALREELTETRSSGKSLDRTELRRIGDARDEVARIDGSLRELRSELDESRVNQSDEPARPELIARKGEINDTREGLSAVTKALADIKRLRLEEKEHEHRDEFEHRCHSVWPGVSEEEALERRPSVEDILIVQNLATERQSILTELQTARELALEAHSQRLTCEETAEDLGPKSDTAELDATIETARSLGDITKKQSDLLHRAKATTATCHQELASLPLFVGDVEAIHRFRLPLSETITAYGVELEDIKTRIVRAEEQLDNARGTLAGLEGEAERYELQHMGSADVLAAARRERESLFEKLVNAWRAGKGLSGDTEAYAGSVGRADRVADERFAAADAISRAEATVERLKRSREDVAAKERALAGASEALAGGTRRWNEIWTGISSEPRAPSEMAEWCRRIGEIRTMAGEARRLDAEAAEVERERVQQVSALRAAMSKLGKNLESMDLSVLIRMAAQHSKANGEKVVRIEQLARDRKRADAAIRKYEAEEQHHARRLSEWQARWVEGIGRLHLSADLEPKNVNEVTNEIRSMFEALEQARGFRKRIRGIERDRDSYIVGARTLLEAVAEDLVPVFDGSFVEAIKELARRLDVEERRASAALVREQNRTRLNDAIERRLTERGEQIAIRDAELAEQKLELAELDEVIERSTLVHGLAEKLEGLERDVLLSTGMRMADIDAEIETRGAEILRSDRIACDDLLRQENEARDRLLELGQAIREKIQIVEGSSSAADHQGEMLAVGAIIDREARRYASLTMGAALLRAEVERYAKAHQSPIIEAASAAFTTITGGRYRKIRAVGRDAERPVLEAVRDDGIECSIPGLSDGTRDQLYLAVRLATLEEYLKSAPVALPVMIDDALVNFDDDRTESTFLALYAFSSRTQVIYFTHHESVVAMAQRALNDKVDVIRLPAVA